MFNLSAISVLFVLYYVSSTLAAGPSDTLPLVRVFDALMGKEFRLFLLEYITVTHSKLFINKNVFLDDVLSFYLRLFRMTSI